MGEGEEEWEQERASEVAYHELLRGPYEAVWLGIDLVDCGGS